MGLNVRKGDEVVVLAGKYRGRKGKVLVALPREGAVIVEGVNMITKHQRPTRSTKPGTQAQTGRITKPAPMAAAKVMLVCPRCGKPSRVGHTVAANGQHTRVCKKCGELVDLS